MYKISRIIKNNFLVYTLRGVASYEKGKNRLQNLIGNYSAFAKKKNRVWEMHNGLQKKIHMYVITEVSYAFFNLYSIPSECNFWILNKQTISGRKINVFFNLFYVKLY